MQTLQNKNGLSLAVSVWLAHDEYTNGQDAHPGQNVISATALLKPTRQLVLAPKVPLEERDLDVSDMIASRFGHAIHDSIEHAWKSGYVSSMKKLGYPQKVIDKIRINPETVEDGDIPIYLEKRHFRTLKVNGIEIVVSGQFDQVIAGELNDTKTTSVYTYINKTKTEDYQLQGSIYRWLNPEIITSDFMKIQHIFTDWQGFKAKIDPNYPQSRLVEFTVSLLPLDQTEAWIRNKIREILSNQDLPEDQVVRCSDKDLWKSDPQYKYYSDPAKAAEGGRSTKNFPNYAAAASFASKQGKGVVVTIPGQVKACGYCPAAAICTQKNEYEIEQ
jgi:hypothetical protein